MTSINRRIFKDSIVVTLLDLVGQALGFVVTMLVAKNFGANWVTDAYYLAFIIPGTFARTPYSVEDLAREAHLLLHAGLTGAIWTSFIDD